MDIIHVHMLREDIENVPQYALPAGYAMRPFGDGDRETWIRIQQACEGPAAGAGEWFDREFARELPRMARRSFFLVAPDGDDVGTITAWYERRHLGRPWGRIHYVAIAPPHRGRGLSRCILTVAMNRLRTLGHRRAMLATQAHRIPAIRTYLRFGFVPEITSPDAADAWRQAARHIDHPALRRGSGWPDAGARHGSSGWNGP